MSSRIPTAVLALAAAFAAAAAPASANPAREAILRDLAVQAKAEDPGFGGFAAERGEALFLARHEGGKPETPRCTSCHTESPYGRGETRAGKPIEPMAVSKTPDRYTDVGKLAKWFGRNCNGVLGRECTAREKGDFITFMMGQ